MRATIQYRTSDEVNFQLALRFAGELRTPLVQAPPGRVEAFRTRWPSLNDLDHLFPEHRESILRELLISPSTVPVAVHGYGLEDTQIVGLTANRVLVSPILLPSLVHSLCQAARKDEEPIAITGDPDGDDMTDPAELCRLVRSTASETHRAISQPTAASFDELEALRKKIDQVKHTVERMRQRHALPLVELGDWLDRLTRKVGDQFRREFM